MPNVSTAELLSGNILSEANLNKKKEEENKAPVNIPFERISEEKSNYDRVESNIQLMLDGGADSAEINQYLVRTEKLPGITMREIRETARVNPLRLSLALARGAVTGAGMLPELPLLAIDALAFLGRKALSAPFGIPVEFENVFSGGKYGPAAGAQQINRFLDSDDLFFRSGFEEGKDPNALPPGVAERAAEKVGEYITPGAALTKGLTGVGAALLRKAPETLNIFQKIAVNAAKNPGRLQAIELGINTAAGISGELAATGAVQLGNEENAEWIRFGTEMVATFGTAVAFSSLSKFGQLTLGKLTLTEAQQTRAANLKVGEIFNAWGAADPNVVNNIRSAARLEREIQRATNNPDFRFTTADVLQNPDAQAAMMKIIQTGKDIGAATRYLRTMEESRKAVTKWIRGLTPIVESGDNFQSRLSAHVDEALDTFQRKLDAAEVKALEEAIYLHPERGPEAAGQHAIQILDDLLEAETNKVTAMYMLIDRTKPTGLNKVKLSLKKAQFDPQNKNFDVEQQLAGLKNNDPVSEMIQIGQVNFGKGITETKIGRLLAYRRLIGKEISVAKNAGDNETATRLLVLRNGVDDQFQALEKVRNVGKEARIIKKANEMRVQVGKRFESARAKVIMNKDLNGINTISPEDVMDRFIRSETGADASRSAKLFKEMFGDSPDAKRLIIDTIDYKLSRFVDDTGRLNSQRARAFLNSHKQNLKKHGVWDRYKNADSAELAARRAKGRFIINRKALEDGQLMKMAKTENIRNFIRSKLSAGRLGETRELIEATGDPMMLRSWKRNVWDIVLSTSDTAGFDTADQMLRNPSTFLKILQDHSDDLIKGLGEKHFRNLEKIAKGLKFTEGKVKTMGVQAIQEAVESHGGQQRVGRMMSKIRASLQGFVSPTFTAVQLLNEGLDHISVNASVKVLQEASYNWRVARQLAKEFVAHEAKRSSKSNTIGFFLTSSIVGGNLVTVDDARTGE